MPFTLVICAPMRMGVTDMWEEAERLESASMTKIYFETKIKVMKLKEEEGDHAIISKQMKKIGRRKTRLRKMEKCLTNSNRKTRKTCIWNNNNNNNYNKLDQTTRPYIINRKKRTCRIVDFAVPTDHWVKLKENEKNNLGPCLGIFFFKCGTWG